MSIKLGVALGLIALLITFVIVNTTDVRVHLIVKTFTAPIAAVITCVFGLGLVTGLLLRGK